MRFFYKEEIINFEAFKTVLTKPGNVETKADEDLRTIIELQLIPNHEKIIKEQSQERILYYLLKESNTISQIAFKLKNDERKLMDSQARISKKLYLIYQEALNELENEINNYTQLHKLIISKELEESKLKDQLLYSKSELSDFINSFRRYNSSQNTQQNQLHLTRIKKILHTSFSAEEMQLFMNQTWRKIIKQIELKLEALSEEGSKNVESVENNYSFITPSIRWEKKYSTAQKIIPFGFSTGMITTISLSAGWHTFGYAFSNVFPPIAVFTLLSSGILATVNHKKNIEKKIEEIGKQLDDFSYNWRSLIYLQNIPELDNSTLSKYLHTLVEEIEVENLNLTLNKLYGDTNPACIAMWHIALEQHQMYTQEAIYQLEQELKIN